MVEEEDWLFRPVARGMLAAEQLIKTEIDLEFIALLNEYIDVQEENQKRHDAAAASK